MTPDPYYRYGRWPLLARVSKWLSTFRFSSTIPRLGPLPLLLLVPKRLESIVPIFSQENGVQSIYEFGPDCSGSVAYFPRIGSYFLSQKHILTAASPVVVACIFYPNHCLLDC